MAWSVAAAIAPAPARSIGNEAGQSSADFPITTFAVSTGTHVVITAGTGNSAATAMLRVQVRRP